MSLSLVNVQGDKIVKVGDWLSAPRPRGVNESGPGVLPAGMRAVIDAASWTPPAVFPWLARAGGVAAAEMLRVFNCGIGMALVVPDAEAASAVLRAAGEAPVLIGHIAAGEAGVVIANEDRLFA